MIGKLTKNPKSQSSAGFSLVEVAISLAILGFACVSLLGMIPVGLTSFHQAMGNTVESQIVQDLSNDILLANFSELNQYAQTYYYNNEGTLLSQGTPPTGAGNTAVFMATVTLPTSAGAGGAVGFGNAVALNNPSNSTSAYSVTITIVNISNPTPHSYTVIIPNNNQ